MGPYQHRYGKCDLYLLDPIILLGIHLTDDSKNITMARKNVPELAHLYYGDVPPSLDLFISNKYYTFEDLVGLIIIFHNKSS